MVSNLKLHLLGNLFFQVQILVLWKIASLQKGRQFCHCKADFAIASVYLFAFSNLSLTSVLSVCALPVLCLSLSPLCIWPPFSFGFKIVCHTVCSVTLYSHCCIPTAVQFAKEMGFWVESLSTNGSVQMWKDWRAKHCQPDYRKVQAHFIEQPNPL